MFEKVLVSIDIEHESARSPALATAASVASAHGAELHLLYVVPPYESSLVGGFFPENHERRVIDEAKARLAALASEADFGELEPRLHVAHGVVYEEVIAVASKLGADLIVLHAFRPGRGHYLLGPNAARVVRHAAQSVFVIRD